MSSFSLPTVWNPLQWKTLFGPYTLWNPLRRKALKPYTQWIVSPVLFVKMRFSLSLTQIRSDVTQEMWRQSRIPAYVRECWTSGKDISFTTLPISTLRYPLSVIFIPLSDFTISSILNEFVMESWLVWRESFIWGKQVFLVERKCSGLFVDCSNKCIYPCNMIMCPFISISCFKHLCLKSKSQNTLFMKSRCTRSTRSISFRAFVTISDW